MTSLLAPVLGVLAVVVVLGVFVWLARKGYFQPDSATDEAGEDREQQSESIGSQEYDIPLRKKAKALSGPYKLLVASLVLLALLALWAVYDVMQTGAPASKYLSREVQYALVGVVGISGGVWLKNWFDGKIGWITVQYERTGQPDLVERIPYAKTATSRQGGVPKVAEIADSRLFGLFWRFRQIGEDRRLRGTSKPLSDVIRHEIPPHGKEQPDGEGWLVRTNEAGDKVLEGPATAADIAYGSPNSLSAERSKELREQNRRKEAELSAVQATNAQLSIELRKLEKKIKNWEYRDREEVLRDFRDVADTIRETHDTITPDKKTNGAGSSPLEDGDDGEGANA